MSEPEAGDSIEAVEILTHGQGLAFQLRDLLLDDQNIPVSGDRLMLAEDLLGKIHGSFTESISALDRRHSADDINKPAEESGEGESSRRSSSFPKAPASRRKRREISEGQSWTEITSTLVHDGHAWRKYGQKPILNSKHSRSYYKCTHKDQLGCPAKKHVQQIGDDPLSYRSVYTFRHTCTMVSDTVLNAPAAQMVFESGPAQPADMNLTSSSSVILNFQSNQQHHPDHDNYNNNNGLMKQEFTTLNDQTEDHLRSVQQLASSNNNLGSSSECMGVDNFMNSSTDYSPYISYSKDTEEPWFF